MKYIKKILFIFIAAIIFGNYEVNALESAYLFKKMNFVISGVHLDIYKSILDSDNNYAGYEATKLYTIDISDKFEEFNFIDDTVIKITINKEKGINKGAYYFPVNLDLTNEQVLALLKTKISKVDADDHYFVRAVIDYSFGNVNEDGTNYNKFYKASYDNRTNEFINSNKQMFFTFDTLNKNTVYSSAFTNFEYKLDGDKEVLTYATEYNEKLPVYMDFFFDYALFVESDDNSFTPSVQYSSPNPIIIKDLEKYRIVSFVGYKNMDEYITKLDNYLHLKIFGKSDDNEGDELEEAEDKNKDTSEEVDVPNTASSIDIGTYLLGVSLVIIGSSLLVFIIRKKNEIAKSQM